MKNIARIFAFCLVCLAAIPGIWGQEGSGFKETYWKMPERFFEWGFDVEGGFGNSLIQLSDVFNVRKTMVIDLKGLNPGRFYAGGNAAFSTFINLNVIENWSFGLFAGLQADGFMGGPKEFTDLLRRGNLQGQSVDISLSMGGSAFMDAGVRVETRINKLRLSFKPAAFSPIFYIPPPTMRLKLLTAGSDMVMDGKLDLDVYSALDMESLFQGGSSDFMPDTIPLGFDIALEGAYTLLPILDLGLNISNVPLVPAQLHYQMRQSFTLAGNWNDLYSDLTGGNLDMPDTTTDQSFQNNASFWVFRPLRFDFFADIRPVEVDLVVIRPHIGFSLLTVQGYDKACFNLGLDGELNLINVFGLSLSTGYRERLWRHALGLRLNFRALELDMGVSLRGPDIVSSFKPRGMGVSLGLRVGF
jgi:hypothetical protein